MIITRDGRTFSQRTQAEEELLLEKELEKLSPDEREALELLLSELREEPPEGPSGPLLIDVLGQAEYKCTPVDMKTFVTDTHYLGHTCDNIYPRLLEDLTELFEGGYHECVWTGSIGCGKTFAASIGVCRVLYELSCMKDPHRSFGLAKDSNISIVALSVSEMLATKVVFENIATKIDASPYFRENFPFERTKKELRFPGNLWVASRASTDTSALGLNTISAFMDESNFMAKAPKNADPRLVGLDRAEIIYNALKRRMKSRFEKFGRLPGMLFVVSSKSTQDDFTARRIRESCDDPSIFVRDYALWDTKPEAYYSSKRFHVLGGNEQTPSRILEESEVEQVRATLAEGCVLVAVPEDFRTDFEKDLEGALRDIAGVSTVAISPFIQRREKIMEAVDPNRSHPFTVTTFEAPATGHTTKGDFLWSAMVQKTRSRVHGERLLPIVHPTAARHVHIDPALRNDALGFCMSHIGGWKDVERRNETGEKYLERAPFYYVDLLLRIVPPVGGEIILGDVRRMVYELSSRGYMITSVSMDSYQSADSLQKFSQKGYTAQLISVDTTPEPYDNLKIALYESRVSYYHYQPLIQELQKLEQRWDARRKRKIDHPPKGSKDVADALAGCLWSLELNAPTSLPLPMVRGLPQSRHGDAWMEEQRHALMAGQAGAEFNQDLVTYGLLPPFLLGPGQSQGSALQTPDDVLALGFGSLYGSPRVR